MNCGQGCSPCGACCVWSFVGGCRLSGLFGLGSQAAQGEASEFTPDYGRSGQAVGTAGITGAELAAAARRAASGVSRQPGRQIGRALEVEQGVRQGFQLIHW